MPVPLEGEPVVEGSERVAELAREAGISSVKMIAWRDLDDPEAGGSELHAHRVAAIWAASGLAVRTRTSMVAGQPLRLRRAGYLATRRGGRYGVFPEVIQNGIRKKAPSSEALVEIWNGMPFFSPLWFKGPRMVFLHHVHGPMWKMALPPLSAKVGETIESTIAPPFYRRSQIVTLSNSSRQEIIEHLHLPAQNITVVEPGIEGRFSPGTGRSATPLVVAVGRLVPVKRFDLLFRTLAEVKLEVPNLRAVVVGEGYLRESLEELRAELGAESWIEMPGRVDDEALIEHYRAAWAVVSTSLREGWGMTLTEAAACGTPSVATDIAGHRDAVEDGTSGLLRAEGRPLTAALTEVLTDAAVRERLSAGALRYAEKFTWQATAERTFEVLATQGHPQR